MDELKKQLTRLQSENLFLKEVIRNQYEKAKKAVSLIDTFNTIEAEATQTNKPYKPEF
ncbi:hypothetical protein N9166_00190 [bacterium]|nr:hypothetical protein [bacterium]